MYLFLVNVRIGRKACSLCPSSLTSSPSLRCGHLTSAPFASISDQRRGPLHRYICWCLLSSHALSFLCHLIPFPRPSLSSLGSLGSLRLSPSPPLLVSMQARKESCSCDSSPCCLCLIRTSIVANPPPPCSSPPSHPPHLSSLPSWQLGPVGWAVSVRARGVPGCSTQSGKSVGCGLGQIWILVLALPPKSC